jgi:hypothetical protein
MPKNSARLRYPWLGTEHLLLGLLHQSGTRAGVVRQSLGVSAASVERALAAEVGPPHEDRPLGDRDEEALRTLGIDLYQVRRHVDAVFGLGALMRGGAEQAHRQDLQARTCGILHVLTHHARGCDPRIGDDV